MYTILCLIGAAGSLVVLTGFLAAVWFGLRTIVTGLLAGQPDVVRWVSIFAVGLVVTVASLALLALCNRRRGMPLTLVWDVDEGRWIPAARRTA